MPEITPQTRAFAQKVLSRAEAALQAPPAADLPPVPADLAGWAWEHSPAGTVRLALASDGQATRYFPPTGDAAGAIDEARAIIAREAALVAAEDGVVEVVEAFRYEALSAEARIVVQQAAKEIRDELDLMRQSAIKIGRRLTDIKELLPHGTWESWLESEFGWSDRTARNYLNQARLAAQNGKFFAFEDRIDPSAMGLLASPSTPEPAREEALRRAEAGERVRHRDAKEITKAAKAEASPAPILRVADHALYTTAETSVSVDTLANGGKKLRKPFAYDGRLWVGLGGQSGGGESSLRECMAVVPVGTAYAPGELSTGYTTFYTGKRASYGGQEYELTGQWLIVTDVTQTAVPAPSFDEAAPPLSTFDRHALAKRGYTVTDRTRLESDDIWEYELQPPPTTRGKPASIWMTLRRIGVLITGTDRPPPPPAAPVLPVPAPAPEILDGVGRQPYGAKGAERWVPNVSSVLIIGERSGYYAPPVLVRAETIYDTPTTVRVKRPDGKEETQSQHKVWAVPTDQAWTAIEAATAAFSAALDSFAAVLRELGRYDRRLAENGGIKQIPTGPLCPSVARADDPDAKNQRSWWLSPWLVPHLERKPVTRHTAKMLASGDIGSYVFAQYDSWLLADDAAWERVQAARQACTDAAAAAEQLLRRLGTYDEALDDGRHQKKPADLSAQLASASAGMRAVGAAQAQAREATDETGEGLGEQLVAAVGAILGGLPEPALRILAAHLCFGDVSDIAFTAPIEEIFAGFAEVASQGSSARMPLAWRAGARAALAELGLAGMPQKAAAD